MASRVWLRGLALAVTLSLMGCLFPPLYVADGGRNDGGRDGAADVRPTGDVPCGAGTTAMCGGRCVDTQSDPENCGGCGVACPRGLHGNATCAAGRCGFACATGFGDCDGNPATGCESDLARDVTHCGTCTTVCAGATNAMPACTAGACGIACRPGFADCDGNTGNGCEARLDAPGSCGMCGTVCSAPEPLCGASGTGYRCVASCATGQTQCGSSCVNTQTDANNCGACGTVCTAPIHGRAVCATGMCGVACDSGYHLCGGECVSNTSTAACGTACMACPTVTNASPTCDGTACGFACSAGFADCDGDTSNGCETNVNNDPTRCGACGTRCTYANATGTCSAGRCALGECRAGYANCDGDATNGCETNVNVSVAHCGRCDNACSGTGAVCTMGACGTGTCAAGTGNCDGMLANGCETNTNTDAAHCGACGNACSFTNAGATCASGACALGACNAGFGNCDGNASNGCETNTNTNASRCGSCTNACSFPNATARCSAGACALESCTLGFGNCDGMAANGCERNLTNTTAHCGACGNACSFANAAASCVSGACALGACNAGYANCDGNPANGCETNTNTSVANCGMCGRACTGAGAICTSGACGVGTCPAGTGDCDSNPGNGCETNTNTSAANCGACGNGCSLPNASAACSGGACVLAGCNPGFADCDGNPANGCEVNTNTPTNCGGCGVACSTIGNTPTCPSGTCVLNCSFNREDCDGNPANGCEANLATASTCGSCTLRCSGSRPVCCVDGYCAINIANCNL